MMKKILLPVLCFMLTALCGYATAWPVQQVTSQVSFRFPAATQSSAVSDQVNFFYQTDSCAYLVQSKKYINNGRVYDSITLAAFYEGMIKGVLKAAKGTLDRKSNITIAGYKGIELQYVKTDENSQPVTFCSRGLLVNEDLLLYSFSASSQRFEQMKSLQEQFFSSVTFQDSSTTQYRPRTATDSIAEAAAIQAIKADTTKVMPLPVPFMQSHAGSIFKTFGLLLLLCVVIYILATFSRRKG